MAQKERRSGDFRFRVSDSLAVPLRGHMLRLRLVDGEPSMLDLKPGRQLRVRAPSGDERLVTIVAHGVPSGRATQDRLDRTRELDVVISNEEAAGGGTPVDIGWHASGPVRDGGS